MVRIGGAAVYTDSEVTDAGPGIVIRRSTNPHEPASFVVVS